MIICNRVFNISKVLRKMIFFFFKKIIKKNVKIVVQISFFLITKKCLEGTY